MNHTILAMDTSTKRCQLAVWRGTKWIGEIMVENGRTHAEMLPEQLDILLTECRIKLEQISRILAIVGPGSFTGLRIGATLVKTLALAQNIDIIPLSSLHLLAFQLNAHLPPLSKLFTVIPGIRHELYVGYYQLDVDGVPKIIREELMDKNEFHLQRSANAPVFTSDDKLAEEFGYCRLIPRFAALLPFPETLDRLAVSREKFHLTYLRVSEAELAWQAEKKKKYQLYIENLWQSTK